MLCENCHKNEATVSYSEIINGQHSEQHLCQECASSAGIVSFSSYSPFLNHDSSISSLLSTILGFPNNQTETKPYTKSDLVCDNCKMTYQEFLKTGRFGCYNCIDVFGSQIEDSFSRIHGSDTHTGKRPINYRANLIDSENINLASEQGQVRGDKSSEAFKEGKTIESDIDKLQAKLSQTIADEEYEEAARLRDEIRALKKEKDKSAQNKEEGDK